MSLSSDHSTTVQDRIDAIESKADRANELYDRAQRIDRERQTAESKNRSFESLKETIGQVREQYSQLQTWEAYAEILSVPVPEKRIRNVTEDVSRVLASLTSTTYEDFADEGEIDEMEATFEEYRRSLRDLTTEFREEIQSEVEDEVASVERLQSLLQIPDIGTQSEIRTCDVYRNELQALLRDNLHEFEVDAFESHRNEFRSLDISLEGYGLTEEAIDIIWDILRDDTVTLAEIDDDVLEDLKTFEEFSNRLSVKFTNAR